VPNVDLMNVSDNPGPRRRRHLRDHDAATTVFRRRTSTKSPSIYEQLTKFAFPLLVCFRIINALCVKTFFQPDEYFQSLEPAWKIAFGSQSGAWITWVGSELTVHNKDSIDGIHAGVAISTSLVVTSSGLCNPLFLFWKNHGNFGNPATVQSNHIDCHPQNIARNICCNRRLFHVETRRAHIWT